mmetsp:Transcript_4642/g.6930  ORF Transcript_4642/g.6930 Transcript_4642/m.6930 type:complete len:341 (-) Transcript_4642:206-1228(-)
MNVSDTLFATSTITRQYFVESNSCIMKHPKAPRKALEYFALDLRNRDTDEVWRRHTLAYVFANFASPKWKQLKREDKQKYYELEELDLERYEWEMELYTEGIGHGVNTSTSEEKTSDSLKVLNIEKTSFRSYVPEPSSNRLPDKLNDKDAFVLAFDIESIKQNSQPTNTGKRKGTISSAKPSSSASSDLASNRRTLNLVSKMEEVKKKEGEDKKSNLEIDELRAKMQEIKESAELKPPLKNSSARNPLALGKVGLVSASSDRARQNPRPLSVTIPSRQSKGTISKRSSSATRNRSPRRKKRSPRWKADQRSITPMRLTLLKKGMSNSPSRKEEDWLKWSF